MVTGFFIVMGQRHIPSDHIITLDIDFRFQMHIYILTYKRHKKGMTVHISFQIAVSSCAGTWQTASLKIQLSKYQAIGTRKGLGDRRDFMSP